MNNQIIEELPQLLELRVPFFDPSFEAMIRMQCKFAEEGYEKLGGVQRYVSSLHLTAIAYQTEICSYALVGTLQITCATIMQRGN